MTKKKTTKDKRFIKTFDLTQFRVFNPKYKECLSGTERAVLDYILIQRLQYVGKFHEYGGNTVKIDITFKKKLLQECEISQKTYEKLITKLIKGGIFNRITYGYFQVNPYAFCKGEDMDYLRNMGIYLESTLAMPINFKGYDIKPKMNFFDQDDDVSKNKSSTQKETDSIQSENPDSGLNEADKQPKKRSKGSALMDKFFERK